MLDVESDLTIRTFLVVDVRRTDFEVRYAMDRCRTGKRDAPGELSSLNSLPTQVAFIRGAVNFPAHSFYQTLDSLVPILSR